MVMRKSLAAVAYMGNALVQGAGKVGATVASYVQLSDSEIPLDEKVPLFERAKSAVMRHGESLADVMRQSNGKLSEEELRVLLALSFRFGNAAAVDYIWMPIFGLTEFSEEELEQMLPLAVAEQRTLLKRMRKHFPAYATATRVLYEAVRQEWAADSVKTLMDEPDVDPDLAFDDHPSALMLALETKQYASLKHIVRRSAFAQETFFTAITNQDEEQLAKWIRFFPMDVVHPVHGSPLAIAFGMYFSTKTDAASRILDAVLAEFPDPDQAIPGLPEGYANLTEMILAVYRDDEKRVHFEASPTLMQKMRAVLRLSCALVKMAQDAIAEGDCDELAFCLDVGCNPNACDASGQTLLHVALRNKAHREALVDILVSKPYSADTLSIATRHKIVPEDTYNIPFESKLYKMLVSANSKMRDTFLSAFDREDVDALLSCLQRGVDPDRIMIEGHWILDYALEPATKKSFKVIDVLSRHSDAAKAQVLALLSQGDIETVKSLHQSGVNLQFTYEDQSPLTVLVAREARSLEEGLFIDKLLVDGLDPDLCSEVSDPGLSKRLTFYSRRAQDKTWAALASGDVEAFQDLLEAGVNPLMADNKGRYLFDRVMMSHDPRLIIALIAYMSDDEVNLPMLSSVSLQGAQTVLPLLYAIRHRLDVHVVSALAEKSTPENIEEVFCDVVRARDPDMFALMLRAKVLPKHWSPVVMQYLNDNQLINYYEKALQEGEGAYAGQLAALVLTRLIDDPVFWRTNVHKSRQEAPVGVREMRNVLRQQGLNVADSVTALREIAVRRQAKTSFLYRLFSLRDDNTKHLYNLLASGQASEMVDSGDFQRLYQNWKGHVQRSFEPRSRH